VRKGSRNKADRLERFEQYYRKTPEMLDNNGPRPISLLFFSLLYPYLPVDYAFPSHFFANQVEGTSPFLLAFFCSPCYWLPQFTESLKRFPVFYKSSKTVYISIDNHWFILEE
jgi:hypothetical protein